MRAPLLAGRRRDCAAPGTSWPERCAHAQSGSALCSAGATTRMVSATPHWVLQSHICLCPSPLCLSPPSLRFLLPPLFLCNFPFLCLFNVSPMFGGWGGEERPLILFPCLSPLVSPSSISESFSASLILHLNFCVSGPLSLSLCR